MKKGLLIGFLLGVLTILGLGAIRPPTPGQMVMVYQTTDAQLYEEIKNAEKWKDFFFLAGDYAWSAYFAGIEAHAQKQYDEIMPRIGLRPE